jgi:hypothetical protein
VSKTHQMQLRNQKAMVQVQKNHTVNQKSGRVIREVIKATHFGLECKQRQPKEHSQRDQSMSRVRSSHIIKKMDRRTVPAKRQLC